MTALSGFLRITCALAALSLLGLLPTLAADPPALELAQTIALPGPAAKRVDHVALDAKRDRLFVANTANNSLDVIDLKQGKVLKSIPGQDTIQGVVYVPDSDRVFATLNSGTCNIFDGDSFKQLKSHKIPNADNPYSDGRGLVYVGAADKKLFKIDAKTLDVKGEVVLASAPASIVVEKNRPRMYVNAHVPRQVHVYDTAKFEAQKKYQLDEAGNYPLALDEAGKRLFVGCRQEPRLVVLDTESGKMLASVPIPGDIDDLYYDAKRKQLYGSCGAGFLVILRESATNKFEVREKLPTMKMARTCLFDADSSRLFVPVPGAKDGPEVRVYRVK